MRNASIVLTNVVTSNPDNLRAQLLLAFALYRVKLEEESARKFYEITHHRDFEKFVHESGELNKPDSIGLQVCGV